MKTIFSIFICFILLACNSKKNIDLKLPEYTPKYVLECYLSPGERFRLLLTQSTGIESNIPVDPVVLADVLIIHKSDTIRLNGLPELDTTYSKAYNYVSDSLVEYDTINPYYLEARILNTSTVLKAQTIFKAKPKFSYMSYTSNENDEYSLNVSIDDINPHQTNYYLFQIFDSSKSYSLDAKLRNRAYFDDDLVTTNNISIYTSFKFEFGEKIIIKSLHLTKEHYDFLSSVDASKDANGNPFGRPTLIQGNVSNAIGIFTSLNFTEKNLTVGD